MDFTLHFNVHTMQLQYEPVMNRRTFYVHFSIGKRTYWLQRWSTASCTKHKPIAFSRDKLMCWTCGARKTEQHK